MGDTITFTIYVENTGDVDLVNVVVTDPLVPDCDNTIAQLAAGANTILHLHGDSCSGLHQHDHRDGR